MRTGTHLGLAALKAVGLTTLLALVLVAGVGTASPGRDRTRPSQGAYERVAERAASDHRCSPALRSSSQVASALVRIPDGTVRVVSFKRGWDVYNGRRPGRLLAFCLDDQRKRLAS